MVRRFDEPIDVRPQEAATSGAEPETGAPGQFIWRGRLYRVNEVIDSWQEQRAWWRDALAVAPASGVAAQGRRVWRVLASPGRCMTPGVFELGHDPEPSRWLLLRTQD